MSDTQSILWLPESLCDQLAAELQELFNDWAKSWGLPAPGPVRAQRVSVGEPLLPADAVDLLAVPSVAFNSALAQAVLKSRIDSPVVAGVVRRMVVRLQEQLRGSFAPQISAIDVAASWQCPGHQGIGVSVALLGQHTYMFLPNAQLIHTGRLSRPATASLPKVNFEAVMASLPLELIAELGHASLSVSDLLHLAPGDVLVLHEELTAPLRLVSSGCPLALTARLGASSDLSHRAVRWSTPS